eukprot:1555075-Rhodomonas_salina.4
MLIFMVEYQPRGSFVGKAGMRICEGSRVFGKYLRKRQVEHNESFAGLSACELGSGSDPDPPAHQLPLGPVLTQRDQELGWEACLRRARA